MIYKKILILLLLGFVIPLFTHCLCVEAQEADLREIVVQIDDVLKVVVFGEKDLSGDYIVDKFGEISFPLIGNVKVDGLTLNQAKDLLEKKLRKFIINPQIISILCETQTSDSGLMHEIKVTVLGAVEKPGDFPKSPSLTLMQVIAEAGDFTKEADIHHINIIRTKKDGGKEVVNVDAGKVLEGLAEDPLLKQNDLISVPFKSQTVGNENITIVGSVAHPGVYPINPGLTLMQLIAIAGDLTRDADMHHVNILRSNSDGSKDVLNADVEKIIGGAMVDLTLNGTDMVSVPQNNQLNFVILLGQVNKPGTYEYQPGMTLLGLIAHAGDFTEMANKSHVKIVRKRGGKLQIIVIDIRRILNGKVADIVLEPNDVISVPESFF